MSSSPRVTGLCVSIPLCMMKKGERFQDLLTHNNSGEAHGIQSHQASILSRARAESAILTHWSVRVVQEARTRARLSGVAEYACWRVKGEEQAIWQHLIVYTFLSFG